MRALLPAEDALALEQQQSAGDEQSRAGACASQCRSCRTSPISTTSIRSTPSLQSSSIRVRPGAALPGDADLIILPGSKATIADLAALRAAGFDIDIAAHRGAAVRF